MRERKIRQTAKDAPDFNRLGLQDRRLGRGSGQGRGLHERGEKS